MHPAASEHSEQAALVARCQVYAARYPALRLLLAIPNGGHRHKTVAARMKAEGQASGAPDLFLAYPAGAYSGLFVELKVGRNKPTPAQLAWLEVLTAVGYRCEVCYGADAAWAVICEYLGVEP